MAGIAIGNPKVFNVEGHLLGGQADAQLVLQGPDDNAIVAAVVTNAPLPGGKLSLGDIKFTASTGNTIPFSALGGKDTVTFTATAGAFFEAGVYPDPAAMIKDLSPEQDIASGIDFVADATSRFMMLRCGYNAGLTAKGAMALGTGASVNFGGSVSRDAFYAVVHQFENTDGARDVIEGTIKSWILPIQFNSVDRFQPRTWVVTELDGSVALNVGVQAGYDYSWMRQFPSGVLKGTLGLKVQLAANAALGFSANGTFAMALARESAAPVIRLSLYKLAKNGWNFAFDASAGEQVTLPDIFATDKNINDLISAVFGVHIAQLVQDLTDPSITSASNVAKFIEQRGMKEFTVLTGINPDQLFAAGKAKVDQFVKDWTDLTHKPATMLAAILQKDKDIAELTKFLTNIQGLNEQDVQALIGKALGQADFFQTPIGQFIESVVPTTPLAAILGSDGWKTVQTLAGKALDIINGKTLQSLIDYATKNLGLDNILKVQNAIDTFNLDAWLQSKIADFLGNDPTAKLVLAEVQKAQTALKALLAKGEQFYDLARQAVTKKYEIDFTATYQKSNTSTALLDVSFDFAANPGLLPVLQKAIDGDMQELLLEQIAGVTIHTATLTHDINRQSHTDLTMPFVNMSTDDVSDSLASVSPVEDNGRVLVYKLDATDDVKKTVGLFHARSVSDSKLSLAANIPVKTGVVIFTQPSVSYGYTLTQASNPTPSIQLLQQLEPLVNEYMADLFGGGKPSLSAWLSAVGTTANLGSDLGATLFSFDVALPGGAFEPWFNTSANEKDKSYFDMSKAMQTKLRKLIPFYYFQDPAKYVEQQQADSVMAYAALPASNGFDPTGGKIGKPNGRVTIDNDGSRDALTALMNTTDFKNALGLEMNRAATLLRTIPKLKNQASAYDVNDNNFLRITSNALKRADQNSSASLPLVLGPLLRFEEDLIESIIKAAVQLAKFKAAAASKPAEAVDHLSSFGDTFVQTFNHNLGGNIVEKSNLRPLGSALLLEAGRALGQGAASKPAGLLRLQLIKPQPPVSVADLVAGNFDRSNVLQQQTLVSGTA